MSANFFDTAAQEASDDEEEEEFDEETGESRKQRGANGQLNGRTEDSSEEEDDDDAEEERRIREGFIVDEEDEEGVRRRKKRKYHQHREEEEEEEGLDEDDLELIGVPKAAPSEKQRYKRLKHGRRDEEPGLNNLFDEDEDDDIDREPVGGVGEFDDFIEEDEPGEGGDIEREDIEVSRRPQRGPGGIANFHHLDEAEAEDMRAAFGDGTEYDWALEMQEAAEDDTFDPEKELELKDVFEPSQLAERMLTEDDYRIRQTDIPERYQIARKAFPEEELTEDDAAMRATQEAQWVSQMMLTKKSVPEEHQEPFRELVTEILRLINVENYEVPFIAQNRKDYLIYARKIPNEHPDGLQYDVQATKLLTQHDVWEILDLDLKFRAFAQKRAAVEKSYESLKGSMGLKDDVLEEMIPQAQSAEEVQDLQDYINFQYSGELKDIAAMNREQPNGVHKKARNVGGVFERLRAAQAYSVVRDGFGTTADAFAQSAMDANNRAYTEDPDERPDDMADKFTDEDYPTGLQVLKAAKAMFAEELATSPRLRKHMRRTFFTESHFDCERTEKGMRMIDEDHPYFEFKYLRNQDLRTFMRKPEFFLRMLQAEREGLIDVQVRLDSEGSVRRNLIKKLESDNFSEIADAWNTLRKEVLESALTKLQKPIMRQVKENLRNECENTLARTCREVLTRKLDQAPYKPRGMALGVEPRVLALTNGAGSATRDPIYWAWLEDGGRVLENGKFDELRPGVPERDMPEGRDVRSFVELVQRRSPDVIAVSGFSVETRILYDNLKQICERNDLRSPEWTDDDDHTRRDPLEVFMVNDEIARLYHTSDRSAVEFPGFAPLTKYCVSIAKYLQGPLLEYVSLGKDVLSLSLHSNQGLLPQEKLMKHLEIAIIEIVNLVGIRINDAVSDPRIANLLPYVSGLGPRKAQYMIQAINRSGGYVNSRDELVGDPDAGKHQAVTAQIFANCASFLIVDFDDHEATSDYLDSTRIHPEDYELARKVAADGLEMDEEDIKAEQDEYGASGIVRKLVREDKQASVNSLMLEMYADQLERVFHQQKRATLETIRAELQEPYDELRPEINAMSSNEMFTMMTGETRDTLTEGMIIPVAIRRSFVDHIEAKLDCGMEGTISDAEYPAGVGIGGQEPRNVFTPHQIVQAKLLSVDRRRLTATLSLSEDKIRRGYQKDFERMPGEWDDAQEEQDRRETTKRKEDVTGRAQRVIKHPLFRPFNAVQAEEFLGSQARGDCIVRPSSKGLDHLAVTWKVSDSVFQHIDVLELDKENEFSVGRVLKVGGRYTYTDLDELIFNHVKAMAKKVDEIQQDERYQGGSKAETGKLKRMWLDAPVTDVVATEKWLNAYMEANPKRSMYAFCLNRDYPGYFLLCFKASPRAKQSSWPIKVIPNAFQLQKNDYPTMMALKNGFKKMFQAQQAQVARY